MSREQRTKEAKGQDPVLDGEEHEKRWRCRFCGTLIVGKWAGRTEDMFCDTHRPNEARKLCGKYLGDNDGTCPQLTCIRTKGHDGDCDNVRGDEQRTDSALPDAPGVLYPGRWHLDGSGVCSACSNDCGHRHPTIAPTYGESAEPARPKHFHERLLGFDRSEPDPDHSTLHCECGDTFTWSGSSLELIPWVDAHEPHLAKPKCRECGGTGTVEEDGTGALGYVVKRPCPDCGPRTEPAWQCKNCSNGPCEPRCIVEESAKADHCESCLALPHMRGCRCSCDVCTGQRGESAAPVEDWTYSTEGRSNSSDLFIKLCVEVSRLIRSSAHDLIIGNSDGVARLIMAQLAHVHGLAPRPSSGGGE